MLQQKCLPWTAMTYCVNVFHLTTSLHLLMTASYVFQVASYPQAVLHTLTDTTAG